MADTEDFKSSAVIVVRPSGSGTYRPAGNLLPTACPPTIVETDPDLAVVIRKWGLLPEAVRAGIVAMVKAASRTRRIGAPLTMPT